LGHQGSLKKKAAAGKKGEKRSRRWGGRKGKIGPAEAKKAKAQGGKGFWKLGGRGDERRKTWVND